MSAYTSQIANICTSFVEFYRRQSRRNTSFTNTLEAHQELILSLSKRVTELETKLAALTNGLESTISEIGEIDK
jgi:hypothetical protein